MGVSPVMSGDGSSPVSRELWKTMLMVRSTNTRRIRAPMLRREGENGLRRAHEDMPAPGWNFRDLKHHCMPDTQACAHTDSAHGPVNTPPRH